MAKIADLYANITANTSGLDRGLKETKAKLNAFGDYVEGTGKRGGLSFAKIASGVAAVTAAVVVAKKVWNFAEQGAQVGRLEIASSKLATSFGGNMNTIVHSIQDASLNTITSYNAMSSASRAMMLGLGADAQELGNLMEIAAFRGRAMGVDTTQAFNDIVTGIGRKSRLILDNLGIIINAKDAYADYGEQIGVAAGELSSSQQVQAYMNAVLTEGNVLMEQAGGLVADYATGFERIAKAKAEFKEDKGMSLGRLFGSRFLSDAEKEVAAREELEILRGKASEYSFEGYEQQAREILRGYGLKPDINAYLAQLGLGEEPELGLPTPEDFTQARNEQRMARQWGRYAIGAGAVNELTNATDELNKTSAIQAGLSIQLAGEYDDVAKSAKQMAFEMMSANLDIETQGEVVMSLATSFDMFDMGAFKAQMAADALTASFKAGEITLDQYIEMGSLLGIELAQLMQGGESDYIINIIVRGGGGAGIDPRTIGNVGRILGIPTGSGATIYDKHGGSVTGLAHGSIVPPGFSNDGMPVMVSSGERLDVTPAGNKNIVNNDLLYEMRGLRSDMQALPEILRDAVLLA